MEHELRKRQSPDVLSLRTFKYAGRWPENPAGEKLQIDSHAVCDVRGVDDQYVYESDGMSLLYSLTETLKTPNLHVTLVQLSDGAHLPDVQAWAANFFKRQRGALEHHREYAKPKK